MVRLILIRLFFIVAILFSTAAYGNLAAAEYVIGTEDVLQITFWQDPSLNQLVTVRQDGKITLSIIGEIQAAGLTSRELAGQIERNVSQYNREVSQATVTVTGFNSQKVFVEGQVANSGKYTFEVIPDVWTIIKEAGGIAEQGDLTRVTIIKSDEKGGEIATINILDAIARGTVDRLPPVESGSTIQVPRTPGGVPGPELVTDYTERRNLFYVYGPVTTPGRHAFEGEMDVLDAIGMAGGTTEAADLSDIRIISKNADGTTVIKTDLEKYKASGQARRIKIKKEDTIIIGQRGRPFLSWENLRDITTITTAVVTVYLLIEAQRDDTPAR